MQPLIIFILLSSIHRFTSAGSPPPPPTTGSEVASSSVQSTATSSDVTSASASTASALNTDTTFSIEVSETSLSSTSLYKTTTATYSFESTSASVTETATESNLPTTSSSSSLPTSPPSGIQVNQNNTQFAFESASPPNSPSRLVYSFGTNGFPHFRVSMFGASTSVGQEETSYMNAAFSWRAGIFRIVEYNDTIGIAESNSSISFVNKTSQWSPIQVSSPSGGNISLSQEANTTFVEAGFVMIITAHVSQTPLSFHGMQVLPNSLKYSVGFSGFPYSLENSSLAIVKAEAALAKFSVVSFNCKHDGGICVGGGRGVMYWTPTVLLDHGNTASVSYNGQVAPLSAFVNQADLSTINATSDGASEEWGVTVFTVPTNRSNLFFWDPEVGINADLVSSGMGAIQSGVETGMGALQSAGESGVGAMISACPMCATFLGRPTTSVGGVAATGTATGGGGAGSGGGGTTAGPPKGVGSFAEGMDAIKGMRVAVVLAVLMMCLA
ncbi:UNVERIFIED_CONTAM: hypothetical protein HDU68_004870 [Siphonaria sp. JEL0065]|nr:hypothetical protein HDU68_004870 [Siphonaria sp. JEL0065]